jgi:hypothetical protein
VSATFTPRMDVLPPAQQALWPRLRPLADLGFVLYGGTAVALRLGHRSSTSSAPCRSIAQAKTKKPAQRYRAGLFV